MILDLYFTSPFPSAIEGTVFGERLSKVFIALLRLFWKIQNDQIAGKILVKDPVLKIRWSEKDESTKFWMACVSLDPFPSFFEKYNKNSFLLCLANFFSTLQVFQQFAVSEHRVGFCKVPKCQYHLLIDDESTDLSSFNIVLNCDFSYQRVDCVFNTFKYYFHCITQIKCLQNWKLLSAFASHRFFRFPVLTTLSFTKKRLLRKNFRSKRTSSKKRFPSFSRTDNVQSYITTIRALKTDEDGPGFPLEEYSKHFLQTYSISHLLKKQKFKFFTSKLSQPSWYWNCISLPLFLQR